MVRPAHWIDRNHVPSQPADSRQFSDPDPWLPDMLHHVRGDHNVGCIRLDWVGVLTSHVRKRVGRLHSDSFPANRIVPDRQLNFGGWTTRTDLQHTSVGPEKLLRVFVKQQNGITVHTFPASRLCPQLLWDPDDLYRPILRMRISEMPVAQANQRSNSLTPFTYLFVAASGE